MAKKLDKRNLKAELNRRLHTERRFDEYIAVREQLKRDGVPARDAWKYAALRFPPLDGSPMEFDVDEAQAKLASITGESPPPAAGLPSAPPQPTPEKPKAAKAKKPAATKPPVADPDDEFALDGSLWSAPVQATAVDAAAVEAAPDAGMVELDAAPPEPPKHHTGWTKFANNVKAAIAGWPPEWAELASKVDAGRTTGAVATVQWVFDYAGVDVKTIDPDSVVSMGALKMLRWVQTSEANYTEFIKSIWSRTIPAKSQLDAESRYADDGRKQFALLDQFEQSLETETQEAT